MNDLSVTKPYQRRRRFSREFKAQIVAQCLEPGASVSRIALDNGLNANMVRRWISEARRAPKSPATTPGFVPVDLGTATSVPALPDKRSIIGIEIPRVGGALVVEWPVEQAHQCAALLRDLLG
ncbi:transposase [uncultured Marinobacter sp.]|jgi:transposase|uniref:IS66-like element accessory protein TnpA n=1 Tax=uncultured Marinobacter sp. TaxID=187379 RepID=UPI0032B2E432|tara:strand:+ start:164 stop:532 length:369 start_codon:yes stop_codon:yes gene_type:complete